MADPRIRVDNLVDVIELARLLDLPWRWLKEEAAHSRIPRLTVTSQRGRRSYFFNPQAVQDHLALRAALGDRAEPLAQQSAVARTTSSGKAAAARKGTKT